MVCLNAGFAYHAPAMNIVLIGYRGSGKSTIGHMLADRLGLHFVDTDDLTCDRLGVRTIAEAWDRFGEIEWRRAEGQAAIDLMHRDNQVVALGGGTIINDHAREAITDRSNTFRIYLRCEPAELYRRIRTDSKFTQTRPNLPELGASIHRIRTMLERREPIYQAAADHVIDVTSQQPEHTVDQAVRFINQATEGAA